MVGARVRDDGVPDDGRVGRVGARGGGPVGRDVDEDLLRVPREEGGEVGLEGELYDGILFLLGGVVVRAALDTIQVRMQRLALGGGRGAAKSAEDRGLEERLHLDIVGADDAAGRARGEEVGGGDEGAEDARDGGEEAEDVLEAGEGGVHAGRRADALAEVGKRGICRTK